MTQSNGERVLSEMTEPTTIRAMSEKLGVKEHVLRQTFRNLCKIGLISVICLSPGPRPKFMYWKTWRPS